MKIKCLIELEHDGDYFNPERFLVLLRAFIEANGQTSCDIGTIMLTTTSEKSINECLQRYEERETN